MTRPVAGYCRVVTETSDLIETVLPTYAVLSRFREEAASREAAVRQVVGRLTEAQEPFHEVVVEREEGSSTYLVVARFVLVSVDRETAVAGLYETLTDAGLTPDEVWVDRQLS